MSRFSDDEKIQFIPVVDDDAAAAHKTRNDSLIAPIILSYISSNTDNLRLSKLTFLAIT